MTALPLELQLAGLPTQDAPRPRVLGLDLSLTCSGVAGIGWADVIKPPAKMRGHDRLAFISAAVVDRLLGVDLVLVEGPSFGSQGSSYHQLAGLWWLITHALWNHGSRVAIVPPSALKKYATGKGNAGKDVVMREVARRFAWFNGDNNAADAAVLAEMGAAWLGAPTVTVPATHRVALDKCEWPARALVGGAA